MKCASRATHTVTGNGWESMPLCEAHARDYLRWSERAHGVLEEVGEDVECVGHWAIGVDVYGRPKPAPAEPQATLPSVPAASHCVPNTPGSHRDTYTDAVNAEAGNRRALCLHDWISIGFERESHTLIREIQRCGLCSSYTYRELVFIGYRAESLEDRIDAEAEDPPRARDGEPRKLDALERQRLWLHKVRNGEHVPVVCGPERRPGTIVGAQSAARGRPVRFTVHLYDGTEVQATVDDLTATEDAIHEERVYNAAKAAHAAGASPEELRAIVTGKQSATFDRLPSEDRACHDCKGTAKIPDGPSNWHDCGTCHGTGKVKYDVWKSKLPLMPARQTINQDIREGINVESPIIDDGARRRGPIGYVTPPKPVLAGVKPDSRLEVRTLVRTTPRPGAIYDDPYFQTIASSPHGLWYLNNRRIGVGYTGDVEGDVYHVTHDLPSATAVVFGLPTAIYRRSELEAIDEDGNSLEAKGATDGL